MKILYSLALLTVSYTSILIGANVDSNTLLARKKFADARAAAEAAGKNYDAKKYNK